MSPDELKGLEVDDPPEVRFPEDRPPIRTLDDLTWDAVYDDSLLDTRVVPLDRKRYEHEAAVERFNELRDKHGWLVVGTPFSTARYWCWRIWDARRSRMVAGSGPARKGQ